MTSVVDDLFAGDDEAMSYNSPVLIKQIVTEQDIVFAVQFDHMDDASHIRQLFEYLQMGFIDGTMIFDRDGIKYSNINGIRTMGASFEINGSEVSYMYNANADEQTVIGINLCTFAKVTKNVGKKNSLLLFYVRNEHFMRYEIMSMLVGGKISQGHGAIPIKQVDYDIVELPEKGQKIASIPIGLFCSSCTILANSSSINHIRIICYERGLKIQGINNAGDIVITQPFYPPVFRFIQGSDVTTLEVHKNAPDTNLGIQLAILDVDRIIMKWMRKMVNIPTITDRVQIYLCPNQEHLIFQFNIARCGVGYTYLCKTAQE